MDCLRLSILLLRWDGGGVEKNGAIMAKVPSPRQCGIALAGGLVLGFSGMGWISLLTT